MLNGKFFTGLPPKMIDRGGASRNRMESHFFWPDDTEVDNAVERRIKRRNSIQLASIERPLYEKQTSVCENGVDTKKRFSKEFSQSSIQFYDNLNEDRANSRRPMQGKSLISKKTQIAEKPTNTKLELPENVIDEAYTTAKKKQAYTSKIEFYDYVDEREESQNNRNNLRKPKMDMNDKREMELNTKNSPKLQVKRDVRSLSEEKETRKINNRDVQRSKPLNRNDNYRERDRGSILNNEEQYLQNRRSIQPRMNTSPRSTMAKKSNNYDERYSSERETYREPISLTYDRRKPLNRDNSEEMTDYRRNSAQAELYDNRRFSHKYYDNLEDNNTRYRKTREEPKRIIRNNTRAQHEPREDKDYAAGADEYQEEVELRSKMRTIHLKSPSPPQTSRKQYYPTEEYYDDEAERYNRRNDQIREPVSAGYSSPPSDAESQNATKSQKHLRSSLCFNDGAIIAENDATRSPTSQYPTQRRNARSSATQRVSVGLPD